MAKGLSQGTVAIVRPGIIGPSLKEPAEGWVDSFHGPAGLCILGGLGILQTVDWEYDMHSEGYAVDMLVNGLLAVGWHSININPNQAQFYNFTSSNLKPVSNGDFLRYGANFVYEWPSMYSVRPPLVPPKHRSHPIIYKLKELVYHTFFAYFLDFMLVLFGYKMM